MAFAIKAVSIWTWGPLKVLLKQARDWTHAFSGWCRLMRWRVSFFWSWNGPAKTHLFTETVSRMTDICNAFLTHNKNTLHMSEIGDNFSHSPNLSWELYFIHIIKLEEWDVPTSDLRFMFWSRNQPTNVLISEFFFLANHFNHVINYSLLFGHLMLFTF